MCVSANRLQLRYNQFQKQEGLANEGRKTGTRQKYPGVFGVEFVNGSGLRCGVRCVLSSMLSGDLASKLKSKDGCLKNVRPFPASITCGTCGSASAAVSSRRYDQLIAAAALALAENLPHTPVSALLQGLLNEV